ncbi:transposable element Tcb2 transposase [Trichonephila clavipes]|nr:transposable element Tcb2 transposase [Trichonephila clavipes]
MDKENCVPRNNYGIVTIPGMKWCHARGNWSAAEYSEVIFSDESRFHFSNDDKSVLVERARGERLNPVFALQRPTAPTAGVMNLGGRTGKVLRPSSVALKNKNREINRLQLAVKLPWAIFFESVDILS